MTFSPTPGILTLIALLAPVAGLMAGPAQVNLAGGAQIEADLLRDTDEAVYLDLGFDVLRVPRDAVTGLVSEDPAQIEADVLAASISGVPEIDDFHEDLDTIRRAIVLVSTPRGFGTGFVINPSGLIVTNNHVIRDEKFVKVTLYSPETDAPVQIEDVEVLALSRSHDIALLQIPPEELPEAPLTALALAPDDSLGVGDRCFVIGNPGMGRSILAQTVSEGIVSSLERTFNELLYVQTTAAVNPGNSGGPLLSAAGQVVGLITYKAYFQENIAFALPIHEIRRFLAHRTAYLVNDLNPNAGHKYLDPGAGNNHQ